ncbi:hypothetical protein V8D89_009846 [Ganoderma adspersum]
MPPLLAHGRLHDVFDHTISALQPLRRITHLRLVAESEVCHFMYWTTAHSERFVCAVRRSAFEFTLVREPLLPFLPSLRYLIVATEGRLSNYGWRVAHEEAGPVDDDQETQRQPGLVELANAVVETIVWTEELFVSEAEESLERFPGRSVIPRPEFPVPNERPHNLLAWFDKCRLSLVIV